MKRENQRRPFVVPSGRAAGGHQCADKASKRQIARTGVNAINRKLNLRSRSLLPASTIKRILKREGLQRTKAPYIPKGRAYPKQEAWCANNVHQADPVVPRFIEGDGRFYSLNIMDIATHRTSLNPSRRKDDESVVEGLVRTWKNLGISISSSWTMNCPSGAATAGPIPSVWSSGSAC